jgi:hypothetical protein
MYWSLNEHLVRRRINRARQESFSCIRNKGWSDCIAGYNDRLCVHAGMQTLDRKYPNDGCSWPDWPFFVTLGQSEGKVAEFQAIV